MFLLLSGAEEQIFHVLDGVVDALHAFLQHLNGTHQGFGGAEAVQTVLRPLPGEFRRVPETLKEKFGILAHFLKIGKKHFRRRGGGRRPAVGDQIADGRPRKHLLVERPEILQTSASSRDQNHIRAVIAVEKADPLRKKLFRALSLHGRRKNPEPERRKALQRNLDEILDRRALRRSDDSDAAGNKGQGLFAIGIEKAFGRKGSPWEALRFTLPDGLEVVVTGQIDRVDSMRDGDAKYVVVIDYKSGRKQLDLSQVFVGLELQLLTYMYVALLNMGEDAVPAAILYCYVRNDKTSLDHVADEEEKKTLYDKKSRLSGYYLDDSQVMTALDTSMEGYSEFLNLRLKKDGTLSNVSHTMYDEAGWQKLLTLAVARIREIAGRIDSGDIAVRPILLGQASPCRYCPYHAVCRFDAQLPDNGYDVVTIRKEDLLEKLDEGGSEHGLDTGTAGGH